MMYLRLYPVTKVLSGEDKLGNKVYVDEISKEYYPCRLTNWTSDDVEVFGRDITKNSRKMFCNGFGIEFAKKLEKVKIEDEIYTIKEVKDIGRWIFFIVGATGL